MQGSTNPLISTKFPDSRSAASAIPANSLPSPRKIPSRIHRICSHGGIGSTRLQQSSRIWQQLKKGNKDTTYEITDTEARSDTINRACFLDRTLLFTELSPHIVSFDRKICNGLNGPGNPFSPARCRN